MNVLHGTTKLRASHIAAGTGQPPRGPGQHRDRGRELRTPKLHTEVSERMYARCLGGAALAVALWRRLDAARIIDKELHGLRRHRPYQESDHILAQALHMVIGGACLDDLTKLQHDPALLRIIGGGRLPDPTTAGAPAAAVSPPLAQPGRLVCSAGLDPKGPGGGSPFR